MTMSRMTATLDTVPGVNVRADGGVGPGVTVWLSGALGGADVSGVLDICRHHLASGQRLLVDVSDLDLADDAGAELLRDLAHRGALVVNASVELAAILARAEGRAGETDRPGIHQSCMGRSRAAMTQHLNA